MPNDVNPLAGLSSGPASPTRLEGGAQSATFDVVGIRLELTASPGAARLLVSRAGTVDTYPIEPAELAAWAVATTKLLSLQAAEAPAGRAEIRAPFLFDREGRPAIAFEALISELGVGYRLLLGDAAEAATGAVTTAEIVRGVAQAASGAGIVAGAAS